MAAQQQQRVAQANAVAAANISSLQRNNTAVMAAAMKRGRQQNVSKQQNNSNSLRNDQFKNFNANMLSNNYQLAAATLAAANTQFLQQVVVSFLKQFFYLKLSWIKRFLMTLGSETRYVESRRCSCCWELIPSITLQQQLVKVQIEWINAKHLHHTIASTAAATSWN